MNQPRMNIYGFPHKALRSLLSKLSMLSGNIDYSDEESLEKLKNLSMELVTLLDLHLHSEEEVVLPDLEARVPGSTEDNIEEHRQLGKAIQAFDSQLKDIVVGSSPDLGPKFYAAITKFHSSYLAHMAIEEDEMNPIIWENFSDEEIMGWHEKIMSTMAPEQISLWFKYIIPALSPFERTIILGGFKANTPSEFFDSVINMLAKNMPASEHSQMLTMLNQSAAPA